MRCHWLPVFCLSAGLLFTPVAGVRANDPVGLPAAGLQIANDGEMRRPRIGLVLGGGGAKGGAHIGVINVLEEMRVPIDCVAGTSMGALIGAVFASGVAPADIERSFRGMDWSHTVGGQGLRNRMPIERKLAEQTYTNALEFGLKDGGLRTPGGLIPTQNIEDEIRTLVSGARFKHEFDDLPMPYRAIATDIISGEMVVLDSGDVSVAMRASMAIPGAFPPVNLGDRVLVDGGFMRNIPVDVARDLCADVVIVVWFPTPAPGGFADQSPLALMRRSLDVMIIQNEQQQIGSLGAQDVNIPVDIGDIGTSQFERVPEAIELGRQAALAVRDSLQRYAVSEAAYLAWRRALGSTDNAGQAIEEVRVVGTKRVSPDFIEARLRTSKAGEILAPREIAADAERIYAIGDFERVEYRLTGPADHRVLELRPVEKSWGPDILKFDFGIATPGDSDIHAIFRADHNRTWTNRSGGRWHNALQLGRQTIVATDVYQPLDVPQRFFVHPVAAFEQNIESVYLNGDRAAEYLIREAYGQVDVGVNFNTRAQLRLGLRHGWNQLKLHTGIPGLPEVDGERDTRLQVRFVYDTRDVIGLPTEGALVNLRYLNSVDGLGGERDYEFVEGIFSPAFRLGGNSLSLTLGGGKVLTGDLPLSEQIELGGIRSFPGLRPGELRGDDYWFAGARYLWRIADLQPVFGQALYGGVRLQAGDVNDSLDFTESDTLYGISGQLTGRTPIGAFLLSLGWVDNGTWRMQFSLGRPIAEGSLLDELN